MNRQLLGNLHRVVNTAFVAPLTVTVTKTRFPFTARAYPLSKAGFANLGLGWLAGQMALYDLYRIDHLTIRWVPSLSDHSSGSVCFYFDPDPAAVAPTAFASLSGNAGLRTTKATRPVSLSVPAGRMNRLPWYNTAATDASGIVGHLVVAITEGNVPLADTGNISVGYFQIRYSVSLKNPTNSSPGQATQGAPLVEQAILDTEGEIHSKLEEIRQLLARGTTLEPSVTRAIQSISTDAEQTLAELTFLKEKVWHCTTNYKVGAGQQHSAFVTTTGYRAIQSDRNPSPVVNTLQQELLEVTKNLRREISDERSE